MRIDSSIDKSISTKLSRRKRRYQNRQKSRLEKRIKSNELHNYNSLLNKVEIFNCIKLCLRGVRWKGSVGRWDLTPLQHTIKVFDVLNKRKFKCGRRSSHIIWERGKLREINAVNMFERVVQKVLCRQVLNPILYPTLIHQNCASQPGKGTDFALNLIKDYIHEELQIPGEIYYLKMDYKSYFPSIPHSVLLNEVRKYIFDEEILELLEQIISANVHSGLDLGAEVNQTLAIFFTNKIDHLIKDKFQFKHYVRYMDDAVIFSHNKDKLISCLKYIENLNKNLKIYFSRNKTKIGKLKNGVKILKTKYHIFKKKLIISPLNKLYHRQRRKIKRMFDLLFRGNTNITYELIKQGNDCWESCMMKKNGWNYVRKIRSFVDRKLLDFNESFALKNL